MRELDKKMNVRVILRYIQILMKGMIRQMILVFHQYKEALNHPICRILYVTYMCENKIGVDLKVVAKIKGLLTMRSNELTNESMN